MLWRHLRWRACREHAAPRSSVRARRFLFLAVMGSYSFAALLPPPSSYSTLLLSVQPSAPALTDSVRAPEVQQPGTRPPRCSSRPPFSAQPKGRKGLREDTRGADAVAAGPRRAPCRSAGSCRAEHLPIASADIAGSGEESEARTADTIEASSSDKSADRSRVLTHACPGRRW